MGILKMLNILTHHKNTSETPPSHIVKAVEKMDKTLMRTQFAKNISLFKTDYLE